MNAIKLFVPSLRAKRSNLLGESINRRTPILSLAFALAALLVGVGGARGQVDSLWSRTYGGGNNDNCYCLIQTADGGFAMAGYTLSYGDGWNDFWLVRTDAAGDSLWSRSFGGTAADRCFSLIQTVDGGFALAGATRSFGHIGNDDYWLVRTDANGDSLWSRSFGGEVPDVCNSLIQTSDGGFALGGYTVSFGAGGQDFWLVRTDENDDSLWSRTFGGENDEGCNSLVQTADGGFALAGYTNSFGAGINDNDFWLVRTNGDGDSLWSRTFDGGGAEYCNSIVQTADGGFALAGWADSFALGHMDFWLVRTNSNGDSLWSRTYGRGIDERCNSIIQTPDGGYALAGYGGDGNFWLVRTNADGDSLWSKTFGGGSETCTSLTQTSDGGFALAGYTDGFGAGGYDFWLLKTTPDPVIAQSISLPRGWNILSSVCQPANPAMPSVWSDIVARGHLYMAKDQLGNFFLPGMNFNNMPPWDVRQGYFAKLSDPDTLVIVNVPTSVGTTIPLMQGWNMVAYFPESDQHVQDAFANLGDNLLLVKDDFGRFYLPRINFSNMVLLTRGKGYQVDVAQAADLVWNVQGRRMEKGKGKREPEATANIQTVHFVQPERTGRNMSVLVSVPVPPDLSGAKSPMNWAEQKLEIGVFTKGGLCVGSTLTSTSTSTIGLAVWGDDPTTPEIDGAAEGEALTFKVWDGQAETPVLLKWEEGEGKYKTDGFAMGTLDVGAQGLAPLPTHFALEEPYPNPFNSFTTIRFSLKEDSKARLTVYDLSGREVSTLVSGDLKAGSHSAVWNAEGFASGIYIVKMETPKFNAVRKVTLIK